MSICIMIKHLLLSYSFKSYSILTKLIFTHLAHIHKVVQLTSHYTWLNQINTADFNWIDKHFPRGLVQYIGIKYHRNILCYYSKLITIKFILSTFTWHCDELSIAMRSDWWCVSWLVFIFHTFITEHVCIGALWVGTLVGTQSLLMNLE